MTQVGPIDNPKGASESAVDVAADKVFADPLLGCLENIARHYDRAVPGKALVAGLPLVDGRLTPNLFARAAARAALSARVIQRPLAKIGDMLLPVILVLADNQAVLLMRRIGKDQAEVIFPESGRGLSTVSLKQLASAYTGYAILVRPEYQFARGDTGSRTPAGSNWFWSAVLPLWRTYAQIVIAAALVNLLALAAPLFIMNVYDRVLPNKALATLWVLAIGMAASITFDFVLKTVRSSLIGNAGRRADVMLASRIFQHVMSLDLSHRPLATGEFANQLRDFENVREFFTSNTIVTITDFLFVWLFVFIIFQIAGVVALVPCVAVILVIALGFFVQKPLNRAVDQAQSEAAHRHSILIEALNGIETIRSCRAESQFQRKWEQFVGHNSRTAEKMRSISSFALNLSGMIQQLVSVGVVIVGIYMFDAGEVSPGAIIASVILASRAVAPLGQIAATLARAQQSLHSLRTLDKIMQTPEEHTQETRHIDKSITSGTIEFKNIVFSYPGAQMPALNEFNLSIQAGERVGIIGRIGSGKTTIGRLIGRLYLPSSGSLLIDGVDIRQYHPSDIRGQVALVSQDAALFSGSVRDNIVLGVPHVSDDLVVRAARLAGVTSFVSRHPNGFNMPVGEGGRFLSSGQRQSIALARALLLDPMIVFLDEVSSAMDMASERELLSRLQSTFRKDQTVIVATHRMAMLAIVDRLIVVDDGRVKADGPKDQVLKQLREVAEAAISKRGKSMRWNRAQQAATEAAIQGLRAATAKSGAGDMPHFDAGSSMPPGMVQPPKARPGAAASPPKPAPKSPGRKG
ncbi:MAG: type I secretion system permease/ATPase [Pseudomonadota bacterium]|nr:type I secretion system permease/ATPase [Pseudomonadota bacterium]